MRILRLTRIQDTINGLSKVSNVFLSDLYLTLAHGSWKISNFLQVGITYTNVLKIIYDCHCYYRENVILWWRSLSNLKWSNVSIVPRSRLLFSILINSFFTSSWSVQSFVFWLMFLSLFMSRESIIDMVYNDLKILKCIIIFFVCG